VSAQDHVIAVQDTSHKRAIRSAILLS